VADK
jgi:DNA-binding GntR family transcriptional regulator